MHESKNMKVKIGLVDFLNSQPIVDKLRTVAESKGWELVDGMPVEINRLIEEDGLDLAFVSSIIYANSPSHYKILPGLSISTSGPAGAIYLFSHLPLNKLNKEKIFLTSKSETSIKLGKLILEEFHEVYPEYSTGDVQAIQDVDFKAILATGDDALQFLEEGRYLYQYDLGDMWKRETGLPFVVSICVVRQQFCQENPEVTAEVHRELLRCRDEGCEELEEICARSAGRIPLSKSKCKEYLQGIEYDLNVEKRKSLQMFFNYLCKRRDKDKEEKTLNMFVSLD